MNVILDLIDLITLDEQTPLSFTRKRIDLSTLNFLLHQCRFLHLNLSFY
jgi:hypothetical protein